MNDKVDLVKHIINGMTVEELQQVATHLELVITNKMAEILKQAADNILRRELQSRQN